MGKKDDGFRYARRGVSAAKEDVKAATAGVDKGLFPGAFCKIVPDCFGRDDEYCAIMHADTAGTKGALAYLYWRETGDLSVFEGIARDAIVMNTDDLLCVGCVDEIALSGTIGRNKARVPGAAIAAIIGGVERIVDQFAGWGVRLVSCGGETADVGDIVRTLDVGFTMSARMRRDAVIDNAAIRPGLVIVGLASFGRATYESEYNSGIGSNGLTSARHDVFAHEYAAKYPETYDENIPEDLVYSGKYRVEDRAPGLPICVGKAALSPTRTYAPIARRVLDELGPRVVGMVHCTGGGQTKCRNFGSGVHYVKDNLFSPPPLFRLIQDCSGADWREMHQVFNMGHRMEFFVEESDAAVIVDAAREYGVEAQIVGHCEAVGEGEENRVTLKTEFGEFCW